MPDTTRIQGPLGIIAGRGPLPCVLAEAAIAREIPLHIVGIRGEAREDIERFPHTWIKWGEIGKMFRALEKNGCGDLVIIGGVNRPDFGNIRFDLGAIKTVPFILSLGQGGDDHVLSRIVQFFEDEGYRVHGAGDVAPELLAGEGSLSAKGPSVEEQADIHIAMKVVRALGPLDVGQAAVVAKGHVIAVEAAEGTDAMLQRCADLRRLGRTRGARSGVLVKAPKPGQEERVDMPTIGPETVRKAAAAGLAGIAVAAGHVLMAERAATIEAANEAKLFLVGEPWDDNGAREPSNLD
ncbi:MAG: LpxI family protein [Methyloceanibacter sp.]|uniref:LpxI family protein n=1 Tax=Methyloceanibacter sp. TaxID=1965321 RepID=UPI003D6CB02A